MTDFLRPQLVRLEYGDRGFAIFEDIDIDNVETFSFTFLVPPIKKREELNPYAIIVDTPDLNIENTQATFYDHNNYFFPNKAFTSRGPHSSRVEPDFNVVGQVYPPVANWPRFYEYLQRPSLIRTLPAHSYYQYDNSTTETGQIYPVFVPSCDKIRDRELPAEPLIGASTGDSAQLIRVRRAAVDLGTYSIQGIESILLASRRLNAQKLSMTLVGGMSYYINQDDPFISANALTENLEGQSAGLRRTMVLRADPLFGSVSGQDSIPDESIYYRNWVDQTYRWDRDFAVDWWAD